ncbi:MAG: 50S ribosomal protein L3 [Spirochaetes bacterium]|nr:50S ribosomal protein L3 [Spirochaetota bacterium]
MKKALIGKKVGMTQFIQENGTVIPVTVCELGPCVVVQKKSVEKDGYSALKFGYADAKEKHLVKPIKDDLKKKNLPLKRIFTEVDVFDEALEVGSVVSCTIFAENDVVNVSGVSKGKGFAGVIKRYGFGGGRKTHGSNFHRAPGSIGACAYPSEVWRGKKMPGHYGDKRVTVKNLKVVKVFPERNIILISGAVPGTRNSIITVREK